MKTTQVLSLSGILLCAGMSVPAFAQTVVGSQTIDGTDLAIVQAHCEALSQDPDHAGDAAAPEGAAATVQPGGAGGQAVEGAAGASTSGSPANPAVAAGNEAVAIDAGSEPAKDAAATEDGEVSGVNLDAITLADCQAANLVEAAKP